MADDIVTRLRLRAAHATDDYLSYAAADEIEQLRALVASQEAEIERLRFAGDALAAAYEAETQPQSDREWKITQMWEEARRG